MSQLVLQNFHQLGQAQNASWMRGDLFRLPPSHPPGCWETQSLLQAKALPSLGGKLRDVVLFPGEQSATSPQKPPTNACSGRREAGSKGPLIPSDGPGSVIIPFRKWHPNEIILGALALNLRQLARKQAPLTTTLWSNDSRDA